MNRPVLEKHLKLSRRDFIVGSAAIAGGGLALGMSVPTWPPENIEELAKRLEEPF